MKLIIIAAVAENGCIGRLGKIPWYFPEDFKHFKSVTMGHTIVMVRKTFESIGSKPLSGRKNVVLSSAFKAKSDMVIENFKKIFELDGDVYICGGSRLYKEALPIADEMIITHVPGEYEGDTFFPLWPLVSPWREHSRRHGENGLVYKIYRRNSDENGGSHNVYARRTQ